MASGEWRVASGELQPFLSPGRTELSPGLWGPPTILRGSPASVILVAQPFLVVPGMGDEMGVPPPRVFLSKSPEDDENKGDVILCSAQESARI